MADTNDSTSIEQWRPVPGWEGVYEVSEQGCVRALVRTRVVNHPKNGRYVITYPAAILKPCLKNGYPFVVLADGLRREPSYVHRLVCAAFNGPAPAGHEVAHNDGCRMNCKAENLRWATRRENMVDKIKHGTASQRGRHPGAKLSLEDVATIEIRLAQGAGQTEIARQFNVTQSVVSRIKNNPRKVQA